ncbi:MAG: hypothetical protein V3575_03895 [Candidatus Absconditabacteria bacterium]
MRKIILVLISLFFTYNFSFAGGGVDIITGSSCEELKCLNNRIDELIEVNKKLQEENKILQNKYTEFNSGLKSYFEVISEKSNAYNIALNQIKYWAWFVGIILSLVGIIFGIRKGKELKDSNDEFKKLLNIKEKKFEKYLSEASEEFKKLLIKYLDGQKINIESYMNSKIDKLISDELYIKLFDKLYIKLFDELNIKFDKESIEINNQLHQTISNTLNENENNNDDGLGELLDKLIK